MPSFFTNVHFNWKHMTLERLKPLSNITKETFSNLTFLWTVFQWDFHVVAVAEIHNAISVLASTWRKKENGLLFSRNLRSVLRERNGEPFQERHTLILLQILFCLPAFNINVTLNYFIKYFISSVTCFSLRTNCGSAVYMSAMFGLKGHLLTLYQKVMCILFLSPS